MNVHWIRILIAAIASEVGAILVLVALIAIFGPSDPDQIQQYAETLGRWVGPISGACFCFLGGIWVARHARDSVIVNGVMVGIATASIDIMLLFVSGTPFQILFLISNCGRIAAACLGGYLVWRNRSVNKS